MSQYHITCYCYECNGSNSETCSGKDAEKGRTAAVHPSKYKDLKGKKVNIEGVGVRVIEDTYNKRLDSNRIDVYVGNTGICRCSSNPINGMRTVTFYQKNE